MLFVTGNEHINDVNASGSLCIVDAVGGRATLPRHRGSDQGRRDGLHLLRVRERRGNGVQLEGGAPRSDESESGNNVNAE